MKNPTDVVCGIIVLILCSIGAYSISSLPGPSGSDFYGPASFPKGVLVLLALAGIVLTIQGMRVPPIKEYWKDRPILKKLFFFLLLFYAYISALSFLDKFFLTSSFYAPPGTGFSITTFSFLMIALPMLGRKRHIQSVIISVITVVVLYFVFGTFFKVILP